ncbi:flagellar export chaperone FliS [Dechloromonas sp. XY25]|uniref:Flagellar secretion chaperone FliS n=1 Tax=Dechloromonas hankyongensis TaxID=2908002 RepID=A0ABS9K6S4_9RHOO|nr:flagellar export chaperone FliS [Dechloromonas hankyongensis]MCG2578868.1 flagellar export chaperone FliS [Dechloromonas hankyongensis]
MFHSASNPISSYQKVEYDANIESASPHQLVALLFQGAEQAVALARVHMESQNLAEKGQSISKAIDIINLGLKASLDLEAGGEIAQNLSALYDYMARRLITANIKNQPAILDEVSMLLKEISSAWGEAAKIITSAQP